MEMGENKVETKVVPECEKEEINTGIERKETSPEEMMGVKDGGYGNSASAGEQQLCFSRSSVYETLTWQPWPRVRKKLGAGPVWRRGDTRMCWGQQGVRCVRPLRCGWESQRGSFITGWSPGTH